MPQLQNHHPALPLEGVRVLLVEDDVDTLGLEVAALRRAGAKVSAATNATAALELLEHGRFDVLVSDLGLPDLDGFAFLRRVRARGETMPAIAVTGMVEEEDVEEASRVGYAAHVKKPLDPADLVLAIRFLAG